MRNWPAALLPSLLLAALIGLAGASPESASNDSSDSTDVVQMQVRPAR